MFWSPQPGPQLKAATCPVDEVLFGGSRGGGKSDCAIGRHLAGAERYQEHWNGLMARRKYKDLAELRRRFDELIRHGLPAERVGGDTQTNFVRFKNGGSLTLTAFQRLDQIDDYQGHQYTEITLDECTNFPWFIKAVDKLKGANRSPHGVPTHIFCTGNPGGPGHLQVKDYFKLGSTGVRPETIFYDDPADPINALTRIFIPSFLKDNIILCQQDPKYVRQLMSIRDPVLRRAWLEGDWDVYIGQAFNLTNRHIIEPIWPIPQTVPIYMTYDWGWGKPFAIGWWWVDNQDRIYRFAEWYGWNGVPDEGLRLEDSMVAQGILEREQKMGISERAIVRLCDPTCFNKKPDYKGGGQGPSTAEVFANNGVHLRPGDPGRMLKIRQMRERLVLPDAEHEAPKLQVYSTCKHFIRTIPALAMDEDRPEDIDTEQEDHIYDEACHIMMARPLGVKEDSMVKAATEAMREKQREGLDGSHKKVWSELDKIRERLEEMNEYE